MKQKIGPLLIILAASLWALDGVLRRNLYALPPITIVTLEHGIGLLVLVLLVRQKNFKKIPLADWKYFVILSLGSSLLGTLFFTSALLKVNFISFSVVYLLQKLQPIFAIIGARVLLKEKVPSAFYKWSLLAIASAYFVTFPDGVINLYTGKETFMAALLALGSAFFWGTGTPISKKILQNYSHIQATATRFLLTSVFGAIGIVLTKNSASLSTLTPSHVSQLLIIALSTGMVALLIYYKGLKHTKASISTILELAFPLLAIGIDAYVYKAMLAPSQLLAATILLVSMYRVAQLNR